jgi:hypothetical protein
VGFLISLDQQEVSIIHAHQSVPRSNVATTI